MINSKQCLEWLKKNYPCADCGGYGTITDTQGDCFPEKCTKCKGSGTQPIEYLQMEVMLKLSKAWKARNSNVAYVPGIMEHEYMLTDVFMILYGFAVQFYEDFICQENIDVSVKRHSDDISILKIIRFVSQIHTSILEPKIVVIDCIGLLLNYTKNKNIPIEQLVNERLKNE